MTATDPTIMGDQLLKIPYQELRRILGLPKEVEILGPYNSAWEPDRTTLYVRIRSHFALKHIPGTPLDAERLQDFIERFDALPAGVKAAANQ